MSTTFLMIANIAVWLGVAGYCLYLAGKQRGLELRLAQMEALKHDD